MSTKTYVSLYKENEKISEHQLFGNNNIFQSFNDYIKSIISTFNYSLYFLLGRDCFLKGTRKVSYEYSD